MIMFGKKFTSSNMKNEIYDIMENYEIGIDRYDINVINAIDKYFRAKNIFNYIIQAPEWEDDEGYTMMVAFTDERNNIQLIYADIIKPMNCDEEEK